MKNIFFILTIVLFSNCYSQTLSKTEIFSHLESQKLEIIKNLLIKDGFIYDKMTNTDGFLLYWFHKESNLGVELLQVGKNNELFMLLYVPVKSYFSTYKELLLTNDFEYKYSTSNDKYYENETMRIGINNNKDIISLFVNLK